jgi:hypothetical protein
MQIDVEAAQSSNEVDDDIGGLTTILLTRMMTYIQTNFSHLSTHLADDGPTKFPDTPAKYRETN